MSGENKHLYKQGSHVITARRSHDFICLEFTSLTLTVHGYCACAARVTVVVLCVCLLQCFNRSVKVEVQMQYKKKLEYKRKVFGKNASFPRNGNVTIYTATIERPFVAPSQGYAPWCSHFYCGSQQVTKPAKTRIFLSSKRTSFSSSLS